MTKEELEIFNWSDTANLKLLVRLAVIIEAVALLLTGQALTELCVYCQAHVGQHGCLLSGPLRIAETVMLFQASI